VPSSKCGSNILWSGKVSISEGRMIIRRSEKENDRKMKKKRKGDYEQRELHKYIELPPEQNTVKESAEKFLHGILGYDRA